MTTIAFDSLDVDPFLCDFAELYIFQGLYSEIKYSYSLLRIHEIAPFYMIVYLFNSIMLKNAKNLTETREKQWGPFTLLIG